MARRPYVHAGAEFPTASLALAERARRRQRVPLHVPHHTVEMVVTFDWERLEPSLIQVPVAHAKLALPALRVHVGQPPRATQSLYPVGPAPRSTPPRFGVVKQAVELTPPALRFPLPIRFSTRYAYPPLATRNPWWHDPKTSVFRPSCHEQRLSDPFIPLDPAPLVGVVKQAVELTPPAPRSRFDPAPLVGVVKQAVELTPPVLCPARPRPACRGGEAGCRANPAGPSLPPVQHAVRVSSFRWLLSILRGMTRKLASFARPAMNKDSRPLYSGSARRATGEMPPPAVSALQWGHGFEAVERLAVGPQTTAATRTLQWGHGFEAVESATPAMRLT